MGQKFEGDAALLHPSKYIRAADLLGKDRILTIDYVLRDEELQMRGGVKEKKPIAFFKETDKGLVLNKTNVGTIVEVYGKTVAGWVGKRISLYPTQDRFGGKLVDCVRIRARAPGGKEAAAE